MSAVRKYSENVLRIVTRLLPSIDRNLGSGKTMYRYDDPGTLRRFDVLKFFTSIEGNNVAQFRVSEIIPYSDDRLEQGPDGFSTRGLNPAIVTELQRTNAPNELFNKLKAAGIDLDEIVGHPAAFLSTDHLHLTYSSMEEAAEGIAQVIASNVWYPRPVLMIPPAPVFEATAGFKVRTRGHLSLIKA